MNNDQVDQQFKIIIIGNAACGKTCSLYYYIEGKSKKHTQYTIGVEFASKTIEQNNKKTKLQIWDTAGQDRFKSVARTYYRGAVGALVFYDCTNRQSFEALYRWIKDARELAHEEIAIVVCGNKCDLEDEKEIQIEEAKQFCEHQSVLFVETSAISGEGINKSFQDLCNQIQSKIDQGLLIDQKPKPIYKPTGPEGITTLQQKKSQERCQQC